VDDPKSRFKQARNTAETASAHLKKRPHARGLHRERVVATELTTANGPSNGLEVGHACHVAFSESPQSLLGASGRRLCESKYR
jgi:hypothetical protein